MNRIDIAHQVSLTLGDHADDYDVEAIIDDLTEAHDGPLNSIDDIDSETYWAIVEKHDTTMATNEDGEDENSDLNTVAWLGVQADGLIHGKGPEVMVLDHQEDGSVSEVMPSTPLPVSLDDDHDTAQDAAETALKAAGWELSGKWDAVDTGYTVKVRRA
jgi:hypothetical protein